MEEKTWLENCYDAATKPTPEGEGHLKVIIDRLTHNGATCIALLRSEISRLQSQKETHPESGQAVKDVVVPTKELEKIYPPKGFSCTCVRKRLDDLSMQEKTELMGRIDTCLAPFDKSDTARIFHSYLSLRGIYIEPLNDRLLL